MIIVRTPLRISFVGGGSDLPAFYRYEPGAVVSTAIDKYVYVVSKRRVFDEDIILHWQRNREVVTSLEDLEHELVREALRKSSLERAIEIFTPADIPAGNSGSGLGSSSSLTVGLLHAFYGHQGKMVSPGSLAQEACEIEIDILGKPIGKQDQYAAAYGGLNYIQFNPDESVKLKKIRCSPETVGQLEQNLLLLYTGITRSSSEILTEEKRILESEEEKRKMMRRMVQLAKDLRGALEKDDLTSFGELLHENWFFKRQMASKITNPMIERWYETARKHGALGGKVLGSGGGGFLLLYAPSEKHREIIRVLEELKPTPFKFEPEGSKMVYQEK